MGQTGLDGRDCRPSSALLVQTDHEAVLPAMLSPAGRTLVYFRSHGTQAPREPWRFGELDTEFYDGLVDMSGCATGFSPISSRKPRG
jgi:hypothetical protein